MRDCADEKPDCVENKIFHGVNRKQIPRVEDKMAKIKDFLNIEHCTNPVYHNSVYKSHWLVSNLCV